MEVKHFMKAHLENNQKHFKYFMIIFHKKVFILLDHDKPNVADIITSKYKRKYFLLK